MQTILLSSLFHMRDPELSFLGEDKHSVPDTQIKPPQSAHHNPGISNVVNKMPAIQEALAFQEPETPQTKWLYFKIFSAGFSFFVAGVNDGSLGSVIPHVMASYSINTDMVSILYGRDPASQRCPCLHL